MTKLVEPFKKVVFTLDGRHKIVLRSDTGYLTNLVSVTKLMEQFIMERFKKVVFTLDGRHKIVSCSLVLQVYKYYLVPESKVETRQRILVRVLEGVLRLVPSENRATSPNVNIAIDPKLKVFTFK